MRVRAIACVFSAMIITTMFTSCGRSEKKTVSLSDSYTVTVSITDGDFSAKARLNRREGGWEIEMLSPDNLKGMELMLTEKNRSITYEELTYTVKTDELPDSSPVILAARLLEQAEANKLSGELCGCDYSITIKDGRPTRASLGGELNVSFGEYDK